MFKILLILFTFLSLKAHAFDSSAMSEKLKKYDAQSVALARDYAKMFDTRKQMEQSAPLIAQQISTQLKSKNPNLTDVQLKKFYDVFFKVALVDSAPLIENMTIIIMLDIFTKEELAETVKFYSTPTGQSILKKFPQMMTRLPEIQTNMAKTVIPEALAKATEALKKEGVELKL